MIVGVHAGEHALGVILAERMRRHAEGERGGDLHLLEQAVADRLLVPGHIVAAPHRGEQQIRIGRQDLGDVRGEVGGAELGPAFGHDLGARQQPLDRQREVLGGVAPVAVVGMQMGDLARLRPGLRGADRRRDAVRRLDVGEAEGVFRLRNGLVEQEVGAAVDEDRQQAHFLGHRTERRRVAARNDAGEQVDLALELHAAKLFDVGVGAGLLRRP